MLHAIPGFYWSPDFPDGTRVRIERDGTATKVHDDGREEPLDVRPGWVAEFVALGDWLRERSAGLQRSAS